MTLESEGRSLAQLFGDLASNVSTLFRKEIELAKAETSEKIGLVSGAVALIAAGVVLFVGALGVVLAALETILAAFLADRGMMPLAANSAAAAIVAIVVGLVAWFLLSRGADRLKAGSLTLDKTTSALGKDAALIKERL